MQLTPKVLLLATVVLITLAFLSQNLKCSLPPVSTKAEKGTPIESLEFTTTWRKIQKLQHPRDCSSAKILFYTLRLHTGFGSELREIASILSYSIFINRTLVLDEPAVVFLQNNTFCTSWDCYFLPISSCKIYPNDGMTNWTIPKRSEGIIDPSPDDRIVHLSGRQWIRAGRMFKVFYAAPKYMGDFWWYAVMYRWLLQPNRYSQQLIDLERKAIGFDPSCIFVHVRHGEKKSEADLHPLSSYMRVASRVANQIETRNIFLSTEDPLVIEQSKNYSSRFHIVYTRNARTNEDRWSPKYNPSRAGIHEEAIIAIVNLFLSRECKYHILTLSSNWAHLVLHMAFNFYGKMPLYHSLDDELAD